MVSKKLSTEERLEKELKTLVSKMKNESTALNKILVHLKSREDEMFRKKAIQANILKSNIQFKP